MPSLTKIQTGFLEPQGAFELTPGTASSPGLFFSGNTSTGMFSPSTGVLGFSTGSTQNALTILADGKVGIGLTNPTVALQVEGDVSISSGSTYQIAGTQISTADVTEHASYLYYTDARVDARIALQSLDLSTKSTSDLAEGTNLYYTDARARSAISITDSGGDGSLSYNSGTGVITYTGPSAAEVRAHFSAGSGISITNGSISVDDDSHNHLISNIDGLQSALDLKAPLASPALTGTPTAPTAASGTNTTQIATTAFVGTAVANLVDSAPTTLDTLNELAAALGDDPNFATTVTNSIATKLPLSGGQMTGNITFSSSQTVDGRDLSVDGAKLDGIAAGAEVNVQSDWNAASGDALILNKPTIPTNNNQLTNGAGYITSADGGDADTVDGIQGASLLRSDANDTATGQITFSYDDDSGNYAQMYVRGPDNHSGIVINPVESKQAHLRFYNNGTQKWQWRVPFQDSSNAEMMLYSWVGTADLYKFNHNGTATFNGGTVWTSANDGSGSGLDADTVDGIQGGSFLRSDANDTTTGQILSTYGDQAFVSQHNGNTSTWRGRILVKNSTADKSSFLGTYASIAGVFAHNNALNAWTDLYVNTVDGSTGGTVRMPSSVLVNGNQVWHAGNDGSGSGLDADLLDGQQGSYYLNTSTSFGGDVSGTYNAIVVANDSHNHTFVTSKGNYVWSASTLPTSFDTGISCSFVRSNEGWFSFGSVLNMKTYSGGGASLQMYVPYSSTYGGTQLKVRFGDYGSNNGNSWTGWKTIWDSASDGAGSGLDADLLDGQQGSYYQPASTAITTSNIGSQSVSSASNIDGISFRNGNSSNGTAPDNVVENGTGYVNSLSLLGQTDGALYSQAYSSSWVHQIYGDYRTGNMAVRGKNSGTWQSWKTVWTSGNDGSGSGLDADNLDGYTWTSGTNATFSRLEFTGVGGNSGNGVHNYAIYQEGGAWSSPYPDLVIGYHTGIKIGGYFGYNGTRFYNDAPGRSGATEIFSVGNGDNHVRVINNLYAPIFYDSNNTGYYVDPASTSKLNYLHVSGGTEGRIVIGDTNSALDTFDASRPSLYFNGGQYPHLTLDSRSGASNGTHGGVISILSALTSGYRRWSMGTASLNPGNLNFGYYDNQANPHYGNGNTGYGVKMWIDTGGNLYSTGSMRSPIFYDSDDTSRYVNPANGGFDMKGGSSNRVRYYTSDSGILVNNAEGVNNTLRLGAAWGRYGVYNTGVLQLMSDSTAGLYFIIDNAQYGTLNTDYFTHTSDIRAPIFYDSNDTTYYLNPGDATAARVYGGIHFGATYSQSKSGFIGRHGSSSGGLNTDAYPGTIYSIGHSYMPSGTGLSNHYGIGYSHTNASFISLSGASGWGMYVASDGDARIYLGGSNGTISCTGNVVAYASDQRLKTNVKPIQNAIDKVMAIRGVEYDWVDNITSEYEFHPTKMHEVGVLAQEVESVQPELVMEAPFNSLYTQKTGWKKIQERLQKEENERASLEGDEPKVIGKSEAKSEFEKLPLEERVSMCEDQKFLTVNYEKLTVLLLEAIKEQQNDINNLKQLIIELKNND